MAHVKTGGRCEQPERSSPHVTPTGPRGTDAESTSARSSHEIAWVSRTGSEPATFGSGGRRSIHSTRGARAQMIPPSVGTALAFGLTLYLEPRPTAQGRRNSALVGRRPGPTCLRRRSIGHDMRSGSLPLQVRFAAGTADRCLVSVRSGSTPRSAGARPSRSHRPPGKRTRRSPGERHRRRESTPD